MDPMGNQLGKSTYIWDDVGMSEDGLYPLVICYVAIEHDHRNSEFSH